MRGFASYPLPRVDPQGISQDEETKYPPQPLKSTTGQHLLIQHFSNLGDQNVGIFLDAEKGHVITFFNGDLATIS